MPFDVLLQEDGGRLLQEDGEGLIFTPVETSAASESLLLQGFFQQDFLGQDFWGGSGEAFLVFTDYSILEITPDLGTGTEFNPTLNPLLFSVQYVDMELVTDGPTEIKGPKDFVFLLNGENRRLSFADKGKIRGSGYRMLYRSSGTPLTDEEGNPLLTEGGIVILVEQGGASAIEDFNYRADLSRSMGRR